jgi:hypothetical protein
MLNGFGSGVNDDNLIGQRRLSGHATQQIAQIGGPVHRGDHYANFVSKLRHG